MSSSTISSPHLCPHAPPEREKNDSRAADLSSAVAYQRPDWVLLGTSAAVRQLRSQIQRIAPYYRIMLVHGETGAGKQFVARAIHALSPGAGGEFVIVPAATLAEVAEGPRPRLHAEALGLVESARGGTLYLEGVGELSFAQQAGLLRFLGGFEERRAVTDRRREDIRIVASSDRDLRTLAAIGQFRQDLYARLSAVEIFVPAVRQRVEDIPELAAAMLCQFAEQTGASPKLLAESTMDRLRESLWPDNLRGLRSVVTRAAALAEGAIIEPRHLMALVQPRFDGQTAISPAKLDRLEDVIERHVLDVLTRCGGNKLRAAELLGISRSTLYRMLDARQSRVAKLL